MQVGPDTASGTRRTRTPARAAAIVGALGLLAMLAAPTLAAKGSAPMTPWISLASTGGAAVPAVQPTLGSSVRFSAGYPTTTKNPWVSLTCYQGSTLVYGQGGAPSADFSLGGASSLWLDVGGAATCRAELGDLYWRGGHQYYTFLASTSFAAGA